jgi:hypothetical protein
MRPRRALATLALLTAAALGATIPPASAAPATETTIASERDPIWGTPGVDGIAEVVVDALRDPIWG